MNTEKQTLDNFDGFLNEDPNEFFGEVITPEETTKIEEDNDKTSENKEERKDSKEKSKEKNEKENVEDLDFFSEREEDEEEDKKKQKEKSSEVKFESDSAKTLDFLKNRGLIELGEEETISDDNADELLEDKLEEYRENAIKEAIADLPEEAKNLIRFTSKGGDPREYFKTLTEIANSKINKNSDIQDIKTQEAAVTEDLKMQGYDEEYIETHIKVLKDSGKLEDIAEKSFNKILKKQEEVEKGQLKKIEEQNRLRKETSKKFKEDLNTFLEESSDVMGYKLSPSEKKSFPDYISNPKVKLENGKKITSLQADLFKAMADKNKLIMLSRILKNDFDLSFVEKQAISKDNKEKRKNIRNDVSPKGTGVKTKNKRPIWELID